MTIQPHQAECMQCLSPFVRVNQKTIYCSALCKGRYKYARAILLQYICTTCNKSFPSRTRKTHCSRDCLSFLQKQSKQAKQNEQPQPFYTDIHHRQTPSAIVDTTQIIISPEMQYYIQQSKERQKQQKIKKAVSRFTNA